MASTANVLLRLHRGDISITLREDGTFSVNSDPKGLIDKDTGTWEAVFGMGTRLDLTYPTETFVFGLLIDWFLKDTKKGQSGDFDPTDGLAYGFDVTEIA